MAAKAGGNPNEIITDINVTPLVDITLVLLIIFMVTANFMVKPSIDLELPKAATGDAKERNQFSLILGADGRLAVAGKVVEEDQVEEALEEQKRLFIEEKTKSAQADGVQYSKVQLEASTAQELTMIIQADKRVSHGRVIKFIDLARQHGIYKYAFNVDQAALDTAPLTGVDDGSGAPPPAGSVPPEPDTLTPEAPAPSETP